jgi:hypothetical protein
MPEDAKGFLFAILLMEAMCALPTGIHPTDL